MNIQQSYGHSGAAGGVRIESIIETYILPYIK